MYYKITNTKSGLFMGVFEAEDVDGALDAMARDAGCVPARPRCRPRGGPVDEDELLVVEEITDRSTTIRVPAKEYEDFDDSLEAAAEAERERRGLDGYDLGPQWEDNEREAILLDIPIEEATIEEVMEYVQRTPR